VEAGVRSPRTATAVAPVSCALCRRRDHSEVSNQLYANYAIGKDVAAMKVRGPPKGHARAVRGPSRTRTGVFDGPSRAVL
jgi:hypothetical protein